MAEHVLDNPAWHSLADRQAASGETYGAFRRYQPDVALFGATATAADRDDLAANLPTDAIVAFWTPERFAAPEGLEIVGGGAASRWSASDIVRRRPTLRCGRSPMPTFRRCLSSSDHPARPLLPAGRTRSGAISACSRTTRLIAMAGERMKPPGYTEDQRRLAPDPGQHRGRGLAKAPDRRRRSTPPRSAARCPMLHVRRRQSPTRSPSTSASASSPAARFSVTVTEARCGSCYRHRAAIREVLRRARRTYGSSLPSRGLRRIGARDSA